MNPISILLWLLPIPAGVFLWSLIASRTGKSIHHTRAFYSGLTGLLAIPALLAAMAGMALQLFWATLASPSGALFIISSMALLVALGVSIASLIWLRRTRAAA
jgi:hypothetical protein